MFLAGGEGKAGAGETGGREGLLYTVPIQRHHVAVADDHRFGAPGGDGRGLFADLVQASAFDLNFIAFGSVDS